MTTMPPLAPCAGLILATLLHTACSVELKRPPIGQAPPGAFEEIVPYPPPAARVETVPPQKSEGEVWIDGQWDWDGKRWKWLPGAWTRPPAGAHFTPWEVKRTEDGQLHFAHATWRAADGRPLGYRRDVCPPGRATSVGDLAEAP
jgi:hypothetical protein